MNTQDAGHHDDERGLFPLRPCGHLARHVYHGQRGCRELMDALLTITYSVFILHLANSKYPFRHFSRLMICFNERSVASSLVISSIDQWHQYSVVSTGCRSRPAHEVLADQSITYSHRRPLAMCGPNGQSRPCRHEP